MMICCTVGVWYTELIAEVVYERGKKAREREERSQGRDMLLQLEVLILVNPSNEDVSGH